jgi:hypothetical protein
VCLPTTMSRWTRLPSVLAHICWNLNIEPNSCWVRMPFLCEV